MEYIDKAKKLNSIEDNIYLTKLSFILMLYLVFLNSSKIAGRKLPRSKIKVSRKEAS
jgi:hypothetical protein